MKILMKWMKAFSGLVLVALVSAAAHAQTQPAPAQSQPAQAHAALLPPLPPPAQVDIAVSGYATFTTKSITNNGMTQTSTNSAGGLFEARRIQTPWIGYELAFSFNPDNQTITPVQGSCGFYCGLPEEKLSVKDITVSADWVFSRHYGRFQPFAVAGFGFTVASSGLKGTFLSLPVKPTYIAGGGVDCAVTSNLGLRLQYRENIFTVPHFDPAYPNTTGFTPVGEPTIGVYYRFKNL